MAFIRCVGGILLLDEEGRRLAANANVCRKKILEKLDLVFLMIDEAVEKGVVLETESEVITSRIKMQNDEASTTASEDLPTSSTARTTTLQGYPGSGQEASFKSALSSVRDQIGNFLSRMSGLGFMAMHPEMASAAYGLKERTHRGEVPDENLKLRLTIVEEVSGFSENYRLKDTCDLGAAFRLFISAYDKEHEAERSRNGLIGKFAYTYAGKAVYSDQRPFDIKINNGDTIKATRQTRTLTGDCVGQPFLTLMIKHPRYPNGPPPPMCGVISVYARPKDGKPVDPTVYPYSCAPPPYPPPDIIVQQESANTRMEYVDREVEVPVTKVVHKIIEIPVPQKSVNKPVVKTVQKFIEVPQVEYVDKYVDVPVKKYVDVVKEVKVPQVVKKYVEKLVEYTPPSSSRTSSEAASQGDQCEDCGTVAAG
ncbi:hypothetical protein Pmar_PMAR001220 [Perkinsus marinus ATCC 50983]|uniref:Uncharacterized protein n=1 Tax=Perkinsus marinus (strain ATCC 50983 / TXsc) TaxID=423536 RepID=C5KT72_PERM5|nr:hypothetical protein Pmar_PMAR001220 [Perkinsus marinus ATCC 50983]EER12422.1 hypothetical protein Pmar_PMAR001220 [Perkinsus marinus ATCC 50983]|eukprot:XP_002780627.1 hypothetical protein Pmar_PMAR001220 [Perkinsus marinus ATCC 50983]